MKMCKICGKEANTDRLLCRDCYRLQRNCHLGKEVPDGKDFVWHTKRYIVTKEGTVFSTITYKYLKPTKMPNGYLMYSFGSVSAGTRIQLYAHRLVAYCYSLVDNLDDERDIDHIDRDKANNSLSNLRVLTHSENELHKKHAKGLLYAYNNAGKYGPFSSVKEMYNALSIAVTLGSFYTQVSRGSGYGYTFTRENTELTD